VVLAEPLACEALSIGDSAPEADDHCGPQAVSPREESASSRGLGGIFRDFAEHSPQNRDRAGDDEVLQKSDRRKIALSD